MTFGFKEIKNILRSSTGKRISFNYVSLLLIQVTNLILPLVTFPYLIRTVGKENFGLIMFAQAICLILYVFVDFGFSLSATRRISMEAGDIEKRSVTFFSVLTTKITLAFVVFGVYLFVIFLVPRFQENSDVFLWSYFFVFGQAIFPDWFFQGIEKMKIMAVISFFAKGLFTILIFVLVLKSDDYIFVPILQGIGYFFAGVLSLFLCAKYLKLKTPSIAVMKEIYVESLNLFISNLAARLINNVAVVFLGFFFSDAVVGIYSSLEKLILTTKGVLVSLFQATFPWLSKQDSTVQHKYIKTMSFIVMIIAMILMLPFVIFPKEILNFLYDDQIITNYDWLLKLMSVSLFLSALFLLYVMHYFPASGKHRERLKTILISATVGLVIGPVLIKSKEIIGALFTTLIMEGLLVIISLYLYNRTKTPKSQV